MIIDSEIYSYEKIKLLCKNKKMRWTSHVMTRMIQRNISIDYVTHAICTGTIIERYPTDYPYPSCLILGIGENNQFLHVVCGLNNDELWLITAYAPSLDKWENDFQKRR